MIVSKYCYLFRQSFQKNLNRKAGAVAFFGAQLKQFMFRKALNRRSPSAARRNSRTSATDFRQQPLVLVSSLLLL